MRLGDHRLLHGRGARRRVNEPHGLVVRERAGPNGILNFRPHNARGDPSRVGEGLSAKHRRRGSGRARHDGEQVAHPIEDHDGDAMRSAKPQRLDAHKSVPAGHDDGGGHSRARVVSQAALAVMDKERAALDGEAGVVGLSRDDAGLDRKTRAPKGVGLQRPRRRRWRAERAGRPAAAQAMDQAAHVFAGSSQTSPARMAARPSRRRPDTP